MAKSFCGSDGVDFWNDEKWKKEIDSNQVLVMIHQVFLDALNHGYFKMPDVCLLIVDECHHTVGNSSYSQIFRHHYHPLKEMNPNSLPRILALSASIVPSKCNIHTFQDKKNELESLLDSRVITTSGQNLGNLLLHVTNPKEQLQYYKENNSCPAFVDATESEFIEKLENIRRAFLQGETFGDKVSYGNAKAQIETRMKKYKRCISGFSEVLRSLGLYCGKYLMPESRSSLEDDKHKCMQPYEMEMVQVVEKFYDELESFWIVKLDLEEGKYLCSILEK